MSNYLTKDINYGQPIDSSAVDLLGKIATLKQQKYDANQKEIQDSLDKFAIQADVMREYGKEYTATKLDSLVSIINNSQGDHDLSKSGVKQKLDSVIKTLVNDKTFQKEYSEGMRLQNYKKGIENLKDSDLKSGKTTYAQQNDIDALEQAGYAQWANDTAGKTSLGQLQYTPYRDVNGKLNEVAKKYDDLMGKEQLLQKTEGAYSTSYTYGEKVTADSIKQNLLNSLDPSDIAQMKINARQTLGKMDRTALEVELYPEVSKKYQDTKLKRATLEAQISSEGNTQKKKELQTKLLNTTDEEKNYKKQLDEKSYDIYSNYGNKLLSSIASNYEIARITDVKTDNLKWDMYKFNVDQDEKAKKKEEEQSLALPTLTEKPQTDEFLKKPDIYTVKSQIKTYDKTLDAILRKNNENGYNSKTPQEQWAYKVSLKSDDPSLSTYSESKQRALRGFQTAQRGYNDIVTKSKEGIKGIIAEQYNSITGAKLENLRAELPFTVNVLKNNKRFEDLDKNTQDLVVYEMGNNYKEHSGGANLTEEQVNLLESSLNSLEGSLAENESDRVRKSIQFVKSNIVGTKKVSQPISFSPVGGIATSYAPINSYTRATPSRTSFSQDTDVTEIESQWGDAKIDFAKSFKDGMDTIYKNASTKAAELSKNLISNKAMSFSTEIKGQAEDAITIKQAIEVSLPEGAQVQIADKNNFTIVKKGDIFEVTASVVRGDNKAKLETFKLTNLSDQLTSKINLAEDDWNSSYKNPNLILPDYTFTAINKETAYQKFMTIAEKRPDVIPPDMRVQLHNNHTLTGTPLQSDEERQEQVQSMPQYTAEKQPMIDSVLNATYKPIFTVGNGVLSARIEITFPDGNKDSWLMNSVSKELDEGKLYVEVLQAIGEYKRTRFEAILKSK